MSPEASARMGRWADYLESVPDATLAAMTPEARREFFLEAMEKWERGEEPPATTVQVQVAPPACKTCDEEGCLSEAVKEGACDLHHTIRRLRKVCEAGRCATSCTRGRCWRRAKRTGTS